MSYFSSQLKQRREQLGLTMQALADRAQVSKSMVCKMERNETQPTIDVAARVARALETTLTEMLHPTQPVKAIVVPQSKQSTWVDASHVERRTLSPVFEGLKLDWLQVTVPPQVEISKVDAIQADREIKVEKYILLTAGRIEFMVEDQTYSLKVGDSFYFDARVAHSFKNPDDKISAQFYMVINYG